MHTTWYVLETGMPADPDEVSTDGAGLLRHKDGVAVAIGPHGPRSRGMSKADIDAARAASTPKPRQAAPAKGREMKPGAEAAGYETR